MDKIVIRANFEGTIEVKDDLSKAKNRANFIYAVLADMLANKFDRINTANLDMEESK